MNGIENITRRIQADAQAEIDTLLSDAKKQASEILDRARAEAEAEGKALAMRNEKAAAEREERLVSVAQMESRKTLLAARQEMVEQAYQLALDKLCSMEAADYVRVLAGLLAKASVTGKEEVILSPEDRQKVGSTIVVTANNSGLNLTLSEETRPIRGGFILRDDKVEVNCAFETLVRLQRGETAGAVAKQLFPAD